MRGRRILAAAAALLLPLSGCGRVGELPYAREMEDMALMRTLGVDLEDGGVRVTASSGVQSRGVDQGEEPPLVLSSVSGTVSGACLAMQSYGTSYVFYGHVGQLLLGEDMAGSGLAEALDYIERDPEMRLGTELFVVRGATAADALFSAASESASSAERLEAIEDDEGEQPDAMTRSVGDVLSDLSKHRAAFAPALELREKREGDGGAGEKQLASAGYAIFREDGLAGWAEGDAAYGVNLMEGQVDADVLELDTDSGKTALRVVDAKTTVGAVFDGDTLTGLAVACTVEANLAQAPEGFSDWDEALLEELRRALEETERARLEAVLDLSRTLEADFLGLKKRAGLAAPWRWAALQEQWEDALPDLDIQVLVKGTILRSYDTAGRV